jgi:hypothetical protein
MKKYLVLICVLILSATVAHAAITVNTDTISATGALNLNPTGSLLIGTTTPAMTVANFESSAGSDPLSDKLHFETTVTSRGTGLENYGEFNTGTSLFATIAPTGADPDYNIYSASIVQALTPISSTAAMAEVYGQIVNNSYNGGDTDTIAEAIVGSTSNTTPVYQIIGIEGRAQAYANANNVIGGYFSSSVENNATVGTIYGDYNTSRISTGSTVANVYQSYLAHFVQTPATNWYGFYSTDLANSATNPYYSWFDSRGVGRCKEDNTFNSVGQSICTVYNPQFTKYTAGAANYERITYGQWSSNTAQIGVEAGGSGVLRPLQLLGSTVGIGTSTPAANFQVTTTSSNATTTAEFGKANQNKGSCLKLYRTDGTPIYAYVGAGATSFTLSTTACAAVSSF